LVGPNTAVTPAPRARSSRSALGENEIDIEGPAGAAATAIKTVLLYHNVTLGKPVLAGKGLCLTCGTSLEQIAAESATRRLFEFVHCDIWHHWHASIPDGVETGTLAGFLGGTNRNVACKHDSSMSQEPIRCG
jgi:hypothetical protein